MIQAADLFCGAGGTSTGLFQACQKLGQELNLVAVNHWPTAIKTHTANHKYAEHICASLDGIDPRKAIPSGHLDLLVASPECTHHSTARGGRPMKDQSRASGWHILRWAELLKIDAILIENVPEYQSWGPIGCDGKPLKSRRGETFTAFINALISLGYKVEHRVLNSANFGTAQTRNRWFLLAVKGRRKITWPEPSHSETGHDELFGKKKKWRAAKEIIDWTIPAKSIFNRKRPLSPKTMNRIMAGLRKFGGAAFLAMMYGTNDARSVNRPMPTVTGGGNHTALCEPFILGLGGPRGKSPVEPFVLGQQSGSAPRSVGKPLPTVSTSGAIALVEPFILNNQFNNTGSSTHKPLPTVTSSKHLAVIEPFIASYYGTDNTRSVRKPLPTVTTKDRFALITPKKNGLTLDITLRMMSARELARAQGFPDTQNFTGSTADQVKQIANAVPVELAEALCLAILQRH